MFVVLVLMLGLAAPASAGPFFAAKVERVFDGGFDLEGPAVAPDGTVYFSDITATAETGMQAGHIWHFDPASGRTTIFRSPSGMANGIKFDAQDRMVIAEGADYGGRRIVRTDLATGKSVILAGLYQGRPFNSPNDLVIDRQGRIYFTDPRYLGREPVEQPVMGVYRIDPDRSVHLVVADAAKPNGIAISPDQRTLYIGCNDNGAMEISGEKGAPPTRFGRMELLAYDLLPDGSARFRRTLVNYLPEEGPDGMVVDAAGNLFVAERSDKRMGIAVYSAEGKELDFVAVPEKPTNVAFGRGSSAGMIYITAGHGLYRTKLKRR
jgi:gluconolactonase